MGQPVSRKNRTFALPACKIPASLTRLCTSFTCFQATADNSKHTAISITSFFSCCNLLCKTDLQI
ncbi:hypothetical protein C7N43_02600 [Sphingobacteriales bacterium UPWRP_1]|nr:hypothetical protein C7N43_02600 [Sphingobacteriales bacterium UPWRP_1]